MSAESPGARRLRTVGVEEELLLVDATTMLPAPVAASVIDSDVAAQAQSAGAPVLEFEVKHEQVEVVSPPLTTFEELYTSIRAGRRSADTAARTTGARAVALATGTLPCEPHLVDSPRFQQMRERFGLTLQEQLTCGFHVHVSVESDEEGVGVLDRIRPWLPLLLAFSANSPFWNGADTGYASYRYQAWSRWPTAGPYDVFGSADAYHEHVRTLLDTDVSIDPGMIYFDARLSRHAPTVETRIADVCLRPVDAAVLAVLTRALVERAAADWRSGVPADPASTALLRLASWRASKSGLDGPLLHPEAGTPVRPATAFDALLSHVRGFFADHSEERIVEAAIDAAIGHGTGATRQRAVMAESGDCAAVVAAAAEETVDG